MPNNSVRIYSEKSVRIDRVEIVVIDGELEISTLGDIDVVGSLYTNSKNINLTAAHDILLDDLVVSTRSRFLEFPSDSQCLLLSELQPTGFQIFSTEGVRLARF